MHQIHLYNFITQLRLIIFNYSEKT